MAACGVLLYRGTVGCSLRGWQSLAKNKIQPITWVRQKFTKSRIPEWVFQPRPGDHEKYGGDPQQPHKFHLVSRIRSGRRRPYWEKDMITRLGLGRRFEPVVHKNIPSVNEKLKVIKHLVRIKPLKLPYGIPTEEEMSASDVYLNSKGELIIRHRLQPVEQKTIDSS